MVLQQVPRHRCVPDEHLGPDQCHPRQRRHEARDGGLPSNITSRPASGTAGTTTCARTPTSTSSRRSTRRPSPSAPGQAIHGPAVTTRSCGQHEVPDALRELRPQRHGLREQHHAVPDLRQRAADQAVLHGAALARRCQLASGSPTRFLQQQLVLALTAASQKCVDARAASTANGTAIQQYACNGTSAQQYQLQPTPTARTRSTTEQPRTGPGRDRRVHGRQRPGTAVVLLRRREPAVAAGRGERRTYHFVNRNSAAGQGHIECLTVPGSSTADSIQLQQAKCAGTSSQSFKLVARLTG